MKKFLTLFLAVALMASSFSASAQAPEKESYLFNHWSVGVGLLEDLHIQAAGTVFPWMQVRVAYATLHPYLGIANAILKKNPAIGGVDPFYKSILIGGEGYHKGGLNLDKIDIAARMHSRELNFFIDFFPTQTSSLHFTVGGVYDFTPDIFTATITPLSNDGKSALQPSDMATKRFFGITTDPSGVVHLNASYGLKTLRPYVGFGFGRPVDVKKRVSVNFDLGVAYIGGLHIYAKDYFDDPDNPVDVELNEDWLNNTQLDGKSLREQMGSDGDEIVKYLGMANTFPILPYARLTINCRLF